MTAGASACTHGELIARVVALEAALVAERELTKERDQRYGQRADFQDRAVATALATAKEATAKADAATETRFEGVNEFRKTLSDQTITFARSETVNLAQGALERRVDALEKGFSNNVSQGQGAKQTWGYIVGAAGLLLAALAYFHATGSTAPAPAYYGQPMSPPPSAVTTPIKP